MTERQTAQRGSAQRGKKSDPTRPVIVVIVVAVLFVFGTLLYKALSGRDEYRAEQAAQEKAWEQAHPAAMPSSAASAGGA